MVSFWGDEKVLALNNGDDCINPVNVLDVLDVTELYFKITNFILYAFYNYIHNTRIYIPTYIAYIYIHTHTHTHTQYTLSSVHSLSRVRLFATP